MNTPNYRPQKNLAHKSTVLTLVLVTGSILFAILLSELIARFWLYGNLKPEYESVQTLREPDPILGWRLIPDTDVWLRTLDYEVHVKTNSYGFRDHEVTPGKNRGTFRIAVLGDSFMEGYQINLEDSFHIKLSSELGKNVEVLNFGVGGYGTTQEYLLLQKIIPEFSPDLVILAFFSGNDVLNNSRLLSRQARKLRNPKEFGRPFAVLDQNSGLLIEKPDYQRMVEWTKKERRKWKKRQENKPFLDKLVLTHLIKASFGQAAETDVSYVNPNILFGVFMEHHENRHRKKNVDYEQAWGESWQVTYRLISEMQKETINAGSKFMIMTVPAKVQIDEKFQNLVENQFGKLDLNYTLPENKLMKFCSESGISCLDLYSAFKTGNSKTPLFHKYIDRHWNKHGHQIAAKEAAKFVKENKLIAPGEQ